MADTNLSNELTRLALQNRGLREALRICIKDYVGSFEIDETNASLAFTLRKLGFDPISGEDYSHIPCPACNDRGILCVGSGAEWDPIRDVLCDCIYHRR